MSIDGYYIEWKSSEKNSNATTLFCTLTFGPFFALKIFLPLNTIALLSARFCIVYCIFESFIRIVIVRFKFLILWQRFISDKCFFHRISHRHGNIRQKYAQKYDLHLLQHRHFHYRYHLRKNLPNRSQKHLLHAL